MTPEQMQQEIRHLKELLAVLIKSDRYMFAKHIELLDGRNMQLGRTTGTKIGTSASQKLSFFGATPVIQQTAHGRIGYAIGSGTNVKDDTTYPDGVGGTKYTVGDIVVALQNVGILAL